MFLAESSPNHPVHVRNIDGEHGFRSARMLVIVMVSFGMVKHKTVLLENFRNFLGVETLTFGMTVRSFVEIQQSVDFVGDDRFDKFLYLLFWNIFRKNFNIYRNLNI